MMISINMYIFYNLVNNEENIRRICQVSNCVICLHLIYMKQSDQLHK